MPAPKLSRTSSLAFVRDQLVFSHTRLLLDARVASLAAPMAELLVHWSKVEAAQCKLWDALTSADAHIASLSDEANQLLTDFASALRALPDRQKTKCWKAYFATPPFELEALALERKMSVVRAWPRQMAKGSETERAWQAQFESLVVRADAALKARADAVEANRLFRSEGALARFFATAEKRRDRLAAAADAIAAEDDALPRRYSARFFRPRAPGKVSEAGESREEREAKRRAAKAAVAAARAELKVVKAEMAKARAKRVR